MPSGPIQLTRAQIDVFELRCPSDRLAKLDLARLTKSNPSNGAVLERLATLGSARLLARIDNTGDLLTGCTLSRTAQIPLVQGISVTASRPAESTIQYASVGLTMNLSGSWQVEQPDQAAIRCMLDLSTVARSSVEVSAGIEMPVFVKINIDRNLVAHNGKPVWTMSNNLPASEDSKGMTSTAIARLVFTRLAPPAEAESAEDQEEDASSPGEQTHGAKVQIDAFELTCTDDQFAAMSLDDIARNDPAGDELLARLKKSGEVRLLSRTQNSLNMSSQSRLAHSAQLPIVQDVVMSSDGKAVPSISYKDTGVVAGIIGRWRHMAAPWADARVEISASSANQSQTRKLSGVSLMSFNKFEVKQRIGTPSGKPVWIMGSGLPDSTDTDGKINVIVLRLRPVWLPGPTPSATDAENVEETRNQEEKPQPAELCVELFDLACTHEQLSGIDLDKITADEPTADTMLERLRKHGQTRLLARIEDAADLGNGLSLKHGIESPSVQGVTIEQGAPRPKITYRDLGLKASFRGRWLPDAASWADVNSDLAIAVDAQSHVKLASGFAPPALIKFSMDQRHLLESGKSVWMMSNRLPQPDDPAGMVNVKITRLKVSAEGKPVAR